MPYTIIRASVLCSPTAHAIGLGVKTGHGERTRSAADQPLELSRRRTGSARREIDRAPYTSGRPWHGRLRTKACRSTHGARGEINSSTARTAGNAHRWRGQVRGDQPADLHSRSRCHGSVPLVTSTRAAQGLSAPRELCSLSTRRPTADSGQRRGTSPSQSASMHRLKGRCLS